MVTCQLYTNSDKENWDNFIATCKTPLFFFARGFIEYHADRFIDFSLMFYQEGELVALLPGSKHGDTLISHGGLTYGGLLFQPNVRGSTISMVVGALVATASLYGFKRIIYKAIPYIFHTHAAQEDIYFISNQLGGSICRRDLSSVIYLKDRIKLSKGRKWLISRAKKLKLEATKSKAWATFHQLLTLVLKKHGATPVHSISELQLLGELFPENIVLKVVEHNNEFLAGVLLFKFDNVVHTQYIATSEHGKEVGALDFLIETCIEDSYNEQYIYFSFGISTEAEGKVLNNGLLAQKESFGARGIVLDFYEINLK